MKTQLLLPLILLLLIIFVKTSLGQSQFDNPSVQKKEYCKSLEIVKITFAKEYSKIKCRYKNTDQDFINFCLTKDILIEYNGKLTPPASHNQIQQNENSSDIEFTFPFIKETFNSINFFCDDDTCFNFINVQVDNTLVNAANNNTNSSTNTIQTENEKMINLLKMGLQPKKNDLMFSKAIFISDKIAGIDNYVAVDETVIIEKGKVWNITSSQAFMKKGENKLYKAKLSVWIDDQAIYFYGPNGNFNGSSIWLPEGKYHIMVKSYKRYSNRDYIFYLSGVEYTIAK